jgi:hypothetical protein
MEGTRFFVKCLPIQKRWMGGCIDKQRLRCCYRSNCIWFWSIYFLEDDEKFYGTGGKTVKVVATVKDQQEIADTQNIYKINFSIYYNKERKKFLVDPKLKANT